MKKFVLPFFSLLLVLTLALSSFSSVTAAGGDDPWVTPVSGDMEFTTSVVSLASHPGVTEISGGLQVPVGFPAGEAQFGGDAVRVTGFDSGKATICYSLRAVEVNQGWGGKVGMWDGTKWVLLPTSIAPVAEEASTTSACAGITGSGTYAFIKYIADASLLPQKPQACGVMTAAYPYILDYSESDDWEMQYGIVFHDSLIPTGTPISYQLINVVQIGFFKSGQFGTGVVVFSDEIDVNQFLAIVEFDPPVIFEFNDDIDLESFTLRVFLPGCYTDFQYPDDLFNLER